MSIRDLEVAGTRQMESIRRRQEREASRMETAHKIRKKDMKDAHAGEMVDLRDEQARAVDTEAGKKERVLVEMNRQLEETRRMNDRNIMDIKENTGKIRESEHNRLASDREQMKETQDLHLEEINYRFNENSKQVNESGRQRVEKVRDMKESELMDREGHYRKKLSDQNELYTTRIQSEGTKYLEIKNDQDRNFKKERLGANARQQVEIAKLTDHHNKNIKTRDEVFRTGMKEQDLMFEKKYQQSLGDHNKNLTGLKDRNEQVVQKMKTTLTEQLNTSAKRSDDPFYNFTELKPQLTNTEDGVIVKVAIPEHSKQDVQLATNGKEVIINYTRRHDDTRKGEGTLNKLQKVESFSSRLTTAHILDPKTVKGSYADGVMTYTLKKA